MPLKHRPFRKGDYVVAQDDRGNYVAARVEGFMPRSARYRVKPYCPMRQNFGSGKPIPAEKMLGRIRRDKLDSIAIACDILNAERQEHIHALESAMRHRAHKILETQSA